MTIKSLTITEDAYDILSRIKHGDESFSETIIRIGQERYVNLDKYFGVLKGGESKAVERISEIKKRRMEFDNNFKNKIAKLNKIRGK